MILDGSICFFENHLSIMASEITYSWIVRDNHDSIFQWEAEVKCGQALLPSPFTSGFFLVIGVLKPRRGVDKTGVGQHSQGSLKFDEY